MFDQKTYKKEYNKKYHAEHREEERIAKKEWDIKNKEKRAAYTKKWEDKNKDWRHNYYLKRKYDISQEQYNELLIKQRGRCAICGTHQLELKKALSVDHNHTTNKVRELLCDKCNVAIGLLNESPDILKKAIEYLQKWNNA
jgi:hypothetical protein